MAKTLDNFKGEIQKLLFELKQAGIDRRQIEKDLNYEEFYIDQIVSKGGNQRFFKALTHYAGNKLSKSADRVDITEDANLLIQEMYQDLIRLKAEARVHGMWVAELAARLKKSSVSTEAGLLRDNVDKEVNRLFSKLKK
jgi:hypothetical protein